MALWRLLPALTLVSGMFTLGWTASVGPAAPTCASAGSLHHAALVIEHSDETVLEYCIGFDADRVTGQYLLQASGVEMAEQYFPSLGEAVCQIDYEPAQYPSGCWTASSPYWGMYVSRSGADWTQSGNGVSSQTFADGDAEGFRYEAQSSRAAPPSPVGVCPPPLATPSPSPAQTPAPASAAVSPARGAAAAGAARAPSAAPASAPAPSPSSTGAAAASAGLGAGAGPPADVVVVVAGSAAHLPAASAPPSGTVLAGGGLAVALSALLVGRAGYDRRRRHRAGADL
ncbi:MAG: hypothetical protein ACYDAC_06055 [Candidatus Dormibacteria bacterium]